MTHQLPVELWLRIYDSLDVEACARASVICQNALWARKKTLPGKVARELPNLVSDFRKNANRFPKTRIRNLEGVDQIVLFLLRRRHCLHCVRRKVTRSGEEFWKAIGLTMCWRCLQTSPKIVSRTEYARILASLGKTPSQRQAMLDRRAHALSSIKSWAGKEGSYYYFTETHDHDIIQCVQRRRGYVRW